MCLCVCVWVFGIGLKVSDKRHRENPVQAKQSACCISVCDRCGDRVCVVIRDGGGEEEVWSYMWILGQLY